MVTRSKLQRQFIAIAHTHVGFSSSMYFHAARSASVLLARYQCILHASTPFSLTSSIDCWFQSCSVNVAVPGSRFSRILLIRVAAVCTHEA